MSTRRKTSHVLACLLLGMVSLGAVFAALLAGDVTTARALGAGLVTLVVTTATIYTLGPDDEERPRPDGRGRFVLDWPSTPCGERPGRNYRQCVTFIAPGAHHGRALELGALAGRGRRSA